MAGSITLSLAQQFAPSGSPYSGALVYFIQAGTVATPQNAFQDLGLTLPWPNPYTLLADGRMPQVYFADGYIKVRMTDSTGVQIFNHDNIPVTGPSSGGGGGGASIDPTTILTTGDIKAVYGTGVITGFVRANARTIGSATSGATERANSDTSALFAFLWNVDAGLAVSGGRGISAAADWAAPKTIALPDFRGRVLAGFDDMGNSAAGRLTPTSGMSGFGIGGAGGAQTYALTLAQVPAGITSSGAYSDIVRGSLGNFSFGVGGTAISAGNGSGALSSTGLSPSGNLTSTNTGGLAHPIIQPTIFVTTYLKL